jgi:hypothetical protein
MNSTILKQNATKSILIIAGIFLGILVLNALLENVASFLAYYL